MRFPAVSGQLAVLVVTASLCCALAPSAVAAPSAPAAQGDSGAATVDPVYTRAALVSVQKEPDGRLLVRLKLLPRAKIPFTTLAFVAVDRAWLAGIPEGAWVKFTARSVEGENFLTSMHVVEECRRFQPCDE
ncbi:MAG: hypothetical protein ACK41V_16125 [Acidovorax sp.]|uniref:hypothetical protein n=1 Tax=Acidovorax sp. TaxID=1872122 RepID=UPI00391D5161